MLRDIPLVLRSLFRRPGFAAAVIVTLGLGLGANAALFSLVDAVMLRPLPYPDSDSLVSLTSTVRRGDSVERRGLSYPDFVDLRDSMTGFESVAAYRNASLVNTGGERAALFRGELVTGGYFDLLGVSPLLGAGFSEGPEREVVLSYSVCSAQSSESRPRCKTGPASHRRFSAKARPPASELPGALAAGSWVPRWRWPGGLDRRARDPFELAFHLPDRSRL